MEGHASQQTSVLVQQDGLDPTARHVIYFIASADDMCMCECVSVNVSVCGGVCVCVCVHVHMLLVLLSLHFTLTMQLSAILHV